MNVGSRLQGRKIVAITKPSARCCVRRWFTSALLLASLVLFFALFFEGRFVVHKIHTLNDYTVMLDRVTSLGYRYEFNIGNVTNETAEHEFYGSLLRQSSEGSGGVGTTTSIEEERDEKAAADEQAEKNSEYENEIEHFNTKQDNATEIPDLLVAVLHFPAYMDDGVEMLMELNGLIGSKAINLLHDANVSMLHRNLVWVGSTIPDRLCNMRLVRQALEFYRLRNPRKKMKKDWTFHLLDWDDHPGRLNRCKNLDKLVGQDHVHYWKRSSVSGRRWNATTQTVEVGRVSTEFDGVRIRPLHLPTRTDIVEGIASAVANVVNRNMTPKELSEFVVMKDRPGDVAHHWPASGGTVDRGTRKGRNDLLRCATSLTLESMTLHPYNLSDVFCGLQGVAVDKGRASTSDAYIYSILRYKIIVVSQRDIYEGHYRLFEGLVSGAMVIHDRIISAPIGLEENVNIVYFDNQDELKIKVMYYLTHNEERLAIARRGRKLAMCQSRTWHRMEQIILGQSITPCAE